MTLTNQTPDSSVVSQLSDTAISSPAPQSFLDRFLGRSVSSTTSSPAPPNPNKAEETLRKLPETKTQSLPVENVTSAVATLGLSENSNTQQITQIAPEHQNSAEPAHTPSEYEKHTAAVSRNVKSQMHSVEKTPEEVADEEEDTLIRVNADTESLLSERRPSHPILRFSGGKALLAHDALENSGLPLGFVWSPFGELQETRNTSRAPHRCGTCGSFVAKGNGAEGLLIGSSQWTCQFCGRNDNEAGNATAETLNDPSLYPELFVDTVGYEHPQSANNTRNRRGAIILIVDENLESQEAEWARTATAAVHIAAAESGLRFALLTTGSGCSAAVRSDDENTLPSMEMMSVATASKLTTNDKERFFLNPPSSVISGTAHTNGTYAELQKAPTDVFISPRAPSAFMGEERPPLENELDEETEPKKHLVRFPPEAESRRLDMAIFVAYELIRDMVDSESSRILSLITGPPTLAEHAIRPNFSSVDGKNAEVRSFEGTDTDVALAKLYEQVGSKAGDMRIALDFLCFSVPDGFAGDILLGAAKRSRGGLVYSAAHSFSAASALAEAAVFLVQRSTSPGVVSIRVSSPLSIARVIGPAFPTASPHTYAVPGTDPITGFCVMLKPNLSTEVGTDPPSHAVLQLAAKSSKVTVVVTVRIPLTTIGEEYFSDIDAEICALILGKACVVSNGALTKPSIACRSLDVTVQRLLLGSEKAVGVVRLLYELRQGLLLGQHVHPNISLILRSFFLRSECALASLLMSPRLFTNVMTDDATGLMAEVQLEKRFLKDDAVHVLDTGFNVFVYVGSGASVEAEEAISESARAVAARRASPCQLWKLKPGKDAEYLLDMYLSPTNRATGRRRLEPFEQGFVPYCASLARGSSTVKALQQMKD
eukprot:gb/GEZJ01000684.1/.p1 GENE.gb/GEZJ01000684.1/~~gb/GEZJ01000684.1/.p1  ORF type:complete len:883 (+),score=130.18 gb/GEZJ01000684.1/:171-2819(+)